MSREFDWGAIVFQPAQMQQIDTLAQRRFREVSVAEEAATYVIEQLGTNDWQRLANYNGEARAETYLYKIVVNLLEEFSRGKFGRPRPPEWLKREGPGWVLIWKMLCLERHPVDHVLQLACAQNKREPAFITSIVRTIRARLPSCGKRDNQSVSVRHTDNEYTNPNGDVVLASPLSLEESIDKAELEERLVLFSELLENLNRPSNSGNGADNGAYELSREWMSEIYDMDKLEALRAQLDLTEEEQLIMRMAFQEGLKLKVIAQALNIPEYQPGRVLKKIYKAAFSAMESCGVKPDSLRTLVAEVEL